MFLFGYVWTAGKYLITALVQFDIECQTTKVVEEDVE
jgi:hypothetical protein